MKKLAIIGAVLIVIGIVTYLYAYGNVQVCPAAAELNPGTACEQANQALGLLTLGALVIFLVGCVLVILNFVGSRRKS